MAQHPSTLKCRSRLEWLKDNPGMINVAWRPVASGVRRLSGVDDKDFVLHLSDEKFSALCEGRDHWC